MWLKVEEGVCLALEVRRRAEDDHARLEAEEEAPLVEEARLKASEKDYVRLEARLKDE